MHTYEHMYKHIYGHCWAHNVWVCSCRAAVYPTSLLMEDCHGTAEELALVISMPLHKGLQLLMSLLFKLNAL